VNSRKLTYLKNAYTGVWDDPVMAFHRSLDEAGWRGIRLSGQRISNPVGRVLSKMNLLGALLPNERAWLAIMMGPVEYQLFPVCYFAECVIYCFDCWPQKYAWWESFFRRHKIRQVFFSARQSAHYFTDRMPGMQSYWLPEATDPREYQAALSLQQRTIDILEMGRRDEVWHEKVTAGLAQKKFRHRYERVKGQLVFPDREALIAGLGNTRMSVCFPGSMTHPERCGNVETVTHRYFESIASGCILLGKCPDELRDIFGYNPVIEADLRDPVGQVAEILHSLDKYESLVSRNYQRLLEVGNWKARVETLTRILQEQGYRVAL
jgi:hypothetical protein